MEFSKKPTTPSFRKIQTHSKYVVKCIHIHSTLMLTYYMHWEFEEVDWIDTRCLPLNTSLIPHSMNGSNPAPNEVKICAHTAFSSRPNTYRVLDTYTVQSTHTHTHPWHRWIAYMYAETSLVIFIASKPASHIELTEKWSINVRPRIFQYLNSDRMQVEQFVFRVGSVLEYTYVYRTWMNVYIYNVQLAGTWAEEKYFVAMAKTFSNDRPSIWRICQRVE